MERDRISVYPPFTISGHIHYVNLIIIETFILLMAQEKNNHNFPQQICLSAVHLPKLPVILIVPTVEGLAVFTSPYFSPHILGLRLEIPGCAKYVVV